MLILNTIFLMYYINLTFFVINNFIIKMKC